MTQRPYSEIGKLIDKLARDRDVRGAKAITEHVRKVTGDGPGRTGWTGILYGDINPSSKTVRLFAEAFELDKEERKRLAMTHIFGG